MKICISAVMIRDMTIKTALSALMIAAFTVPSSAQIRVDARIHSSAGSCSQCDLSNKRMNGMTLKDANFSGSIFNNSNLSGGNFDGSNLTGSHFRKALLYSVEGENVNMNGADLQDATATDVNFQNGNFAEARLDHINLHKANLDGGHFNGVTFGNAILLDATMMATDLSDADLSMAQGLKQEQLNAACGNMNTKLPDGLYVPYCEGSMVAEAGHSHDKLDPEMAKAAKRLERAIEDVEIILKATPTSNRPLRRKLQSIHSDLVKSKRTIER